MKYQLIFIDSIIFFVISVFFSSIIYAQDTSAMNEMSKKLHALFEREWEYGLREYPESATYEGDRRYNDRLTDMSFAAIERRQKHDAEVLVEIGRIKRSLLSETDQLNYDLFKRQYREAVESYRFRDFLMSVTKLGGPQINFPALVRFTPFDNKKDYQNYLKRLAAFPRCVDQVIALMRKGMAEGWMIPRVILRGVPDQISAQMKDVQNGVFMQSFKNFPERISGAERSRLRTAGSDAIEKYLTPAYQKFYDFFTKIYLPNAPREVGAWQYPNGKKFYEFKVKAFTTTSMTPEEIHDIGLREVKRIRAEMEAIIQKVNFQGDFAAFVDFLRTDARFYFDKPADLLIAYRNICKRIDPALVKLFGRLPRLPYGVREIPANEAPTSYVGYYQPPAGDGSRAGYFYANTYKPETRPKYEMEALTAHEAVPGHHLQIALAMELDDLPEFRQHSSITAFVEGWALYSESLGEDVGLYSDPYSKFGQLTYEMWRACRLVVDTGMHYFKWPRQKAIDFMLANTAKTELDIINEVDRYIGWPGQALAYKIGELKIKELRKLAEITLGDAFDIREFHDRILENGAIPLDVLASKIKMYIAEKQAE